MNKVGFVAATVVAMAMGAFAQRSALAAGDSEAGGAKARIADMGADSPKALVESMAVVLGKDMKPQAWLAFQPPSSRALVKEQSELAAKLTAKSKEVSDLVAARIGKMEGQMIGTMQGGVTNGGELDVQYQMLQIAPEGKVDWSQATITENGDKATVTIKDHGGTISLVKVNGKWYLSGEALAKDVEGSKKMTAKLMKLLDDLAAKVKSGEINKQNFMQQYQNMVNSEMMSG